MVSIYEFINEQNTRYNRKVKFEIKKQSDLQGHLLVHLWVLLATWLLVAVFSFFFVLEHL